MFPVAKQYPRVLFGQRWASGFWAFRAPLVCTAATGHIITALLISAPNTVPRLAFVGYAVWKALGSLTTLRGNQTGFSGRAVFAGIASNPIPGKNTTESQAAVAHRRPLPGSGSQADRLRLYPGRHQHRRCSDTGRVGYGLDAGRVAPGYAGGAGAGSAGAGHWVPVVAVSLPLR